MQITYGAILRLTCSLEKLLNILFVITFKKNMTSSLTTLKNLRLVYSVKYCKCVVFQCIVEGFVSFKYFSLFRVDAPGSEKYPICCKDKLFQLNKKIRVKSILSVKASCSKCIIFTFFRWWIIITNMDKVRSFRTYPQFCIMQLFCANDRTLSSSQYCALLSSWSILLMPVLLPINKECESSRINLH